MNPHRAALPAGRLAEAAGATAPLRAAAARQGPSPGFVTAGTRQVLTPRTMASVPSTGRAAPPLPAWRAAPQAPRPRDWPEEAPSAAPPAPAAPSPAHPPRPAHTRRTAVPPTLVTARTGPDFARPPSSHRQAASAPSTSRATALTAALPARSVEFLRVP